MNGDALELFIERRSHDSQPQRVKMYMHLVWLTIHIHSLNGLIYKVKSNAKEAQQQGQGDSSSHIIDLHNNNFILIYMKTVKSLKVTQTDALKLLVQEQDDNRLNACFQGMR